MENHEEHKKTHWKSVQDNKYIGSFAFQPGQEITATIDKIEREEVIGEGARKDMCTVLYFKNAKLPMILNKTNAKIITKVHKSPYFEDWVGKPITLYVAKVKFKGAVVDGIRIKNV